MANWPKILRFCILDVYFAKKKRFWSIQSHYNIHRPRKVQFWYCLLCTTIFSVHLWIYSVPNHKLALKLNILYFWPSFYPKFSPFCNFCCPYNLSTYLIVHLWHCFVCTTICSVHLCIYSAPNGPFGLSISLYCTNNIRKIASLDKFFYKIDYGL